MRPLRVPFADLRRLWPPGFCWSERMSHRYTPIIVALTAQGGACRTPTYGRNATEHGVNTDRYTTDIRRTMGVATPLPAFSMADTRRRSWNSRLPVTSPATVNSVTRFAESRKQRPEPAIDLLRYAPSPKHPGSRTGTSREANPTTSAPKSQRHSHRRRQSGCHCNLPAYRGPTLARCPVGRTLRSPVLGRQFPRGNRDGPGDRITRRPVRRSCRYRQESGALRRHFRSCPADRHGRGRRRGHRGRVQSRPGFGRTGENSARCRRAPWPAMNRGRHALILASQRLRHSDNQTRADRLRNCPRIVPSRAPFRPLEGAET